MKEIPKYEIPAGLEIKKLPPGLRSRKQQPEERLDDTTKWLTQNDKEWNERRLKQMHRKKMRRRKHLPRRSLLTAINETASRLLKPSS